MPICTPTEKNKQDDEVSPVATIAHDTVWPHKKSHRQFRLKVTQFAVSVTCLSFCAADEEDLLFRRCVDAGAEWLWSVAGAQMWEQSGYGVYPTHQFQVSSELC
jgi:hypothetical protein